MENNLENRLGMFQKTKGYLAAHSAELAFIAVIAILEAQLEDHIDAIIANAAIADADPTGAMVDKQNKRHKLRLAVYKVSSGCIALASITNNIIMLEKVDETPSSMDGMRDNDFYVYSQTVTSVATPNAAAPAKKAAAPAKKAAAPAKKATAPAKKAAASKKAAAPKK